MNLKNIIASYQTDINHATVEKEIKRITGNISDIFNVETLKKLFGFIDLTTLKETDNPERAKLFAENVNNFQANFPDLPNVAAICVYPTLVEYIKQYLKVDAVHIASVTGAFPASQTFIDIKEAETKRVFEKGADEADMVISVGTFLAGDYETVFDEIKRLKTIAGDKHLKVILETGSLNSLKDIKIASILAAEAGCDFLKTSTGKVHPAATLEAVYVMAQTAKEYSEKTGKKIGIKPAGGISDTETALKYYALIKEVLGEDYLSPEYFRIGASSLANNLLTDISKMSTDSGKEIKWF